ncbi:hypothetical protein [Devosia nitrariae]|uniref:Uncharacterized protein n=1 Tax=Devosia nitrariae TaxID=2071872 RepID=A0ABQ5WDQ5_9HYPH|nr:hypothetical protein [Devosia nitrariae]GLQ57625.1 hypothetical protein GCM10010862_48840 [Devosia nitrariae]
MQLKSAIVGMLVAGVLASPAWASGGIYCNAGDAAGIDLATGRLAVLHILDATVSVGEETWTTAPARISGTPIVVGQAFEDADSIAVDLMDDNYEAILVRLRLVTEREADEIVIAGTLAVAGRGVWAVTCEAG